MFKEYNL